ncbi:hypothetical protein [Mycolicibacterium phlei]|uniref:hypothetical protein n=1 Tax=Mycolicibacterium phlei TaxID=1771 RepID=UPI0002D4675C|nr:hypothetical protein [Mycolicibacterium phlei]MBF4194610.1 hypothetical protein [Mycolicibacterium phlei]
MGEWPWPNDTREDRLKRIIDSYRTALMEVDPQTCRLIDARMVAYGQKWITSDVVVDVERLVTAQEVAEQFDINPWNVHDWARRHPDKIPRRGKKNGKTLFRLGDIIAYQAKGGRR